MSIEVLKLIFKIYNKNAYILIIYELKVYEQYTTFFLIFLSKKIYICTIELGTWEGKVSEIFLEEAYAIFNNSSLVV